MQRSVGYVSVVSALVLSFAVTGCGQATTGQGGKQPSQTTTQSRAADAAGNPPFQNKLKVEVGQLDQNYDPKSVSASTFTHVQVVDGQGQKMTLSAAKQPILFVAYWCPHCQRTLVMLTKNESKLRQLPVIVSMGFQPGTTVAQAKKLTDAEHTTLGLSNQFHVYYGLYKNNAKYVPIGYPTLVFSDGQKLQMLAGEHTLGVWQHALSTAKG